VAPRGQQEGGHPERPPARRCRGTRRYEVMRFCHRVIEVQVHLGMGDERRGLQVDIQASLAYERLYLIGTHVRDLL
jgi:hypothetical protein